MARIEVTSRGCALNDELSAAVKREAGRLAEEWEGVESIDVAIEAANALGRGARAWVRITLATREEIVTVSAPAAPDPPDEELRDALARGVERAFGDARRRLSRTPSARPPPASAG
ncbi:MAG: hypothetical protein U0414_22565 [Polyangiaceae bacterium]